MNDKLTTNNSSDGLLQSYINAISNIVTMQTANFLAEDYEKEIVNNLGSLNTRNGVFITTSDIPDGRAEKFVKDSVNAHLAKVQSNQIKSVTVQEIERLKTDTLRRFKGKKINIIKINSKSDIFDAVYLDSETGGYRISKYTAKSIKGTVEDISYEDNLLVIKPSYFSRILAPNRILIHVYVLDIQTMEPNINVKV